MCENYLNSVHKGDILRILGTHDKDKYFSVNINFLELFESNTNLGNALLTDPENSLKSWNEAVFNVQSNLIKEFDQKHTIKNNVNCRVYSLPPWPHVCRTIFPGNDDADQFLQVTGTVVRMSGRKLLEYQRQYICTKCKYPITVEANYDKRNIIKNPTKCTNPEGCTGKNIITFGELDSYNCRDYQEIKIQEDLSKMSVGTVPGHMVVTLEDDLVNICKPGENVTITGIVKRRWSEFDKGVKITVDIVLKANHVQVNNSSGLSLAVSDDMKQFFDSFWTRYGHNPLVGRNIILKSICPEIYGRQLVKLAIAIVLAGGSPNEENQISTGIDTRSESHLLLVGDPGTGKSQMLRFASKIIPRSVLTTGVGSTAAGLTVTAIMENGEWQLEAGALVMADGGICCIDEFNSMREHDRTSIHEAMEQQTISVAKAGMVCKLKTRCSILAACNPKGNIDPSQPLCVNVAMSSPLLSRFDLILLLRDIVNEENDRQLAEYLLNKSCELSGEDVFWSLEKLQAYYAVIKKEIPKLTAEAESILSTYYQLQRKFGSRNKSRTTVRLLESLIRLSQGHAKLIYHQEVEVIDTIFAIILVDAALDYESSLLNLNIDYESFFDNPNDVYWDILENILGKLHLDYIYQRECEKLGVNIKDSGQSTNVSPSQKQNETSSYFEDLKVISHDTITNVPKRTQLFSQRNSCLKQCEQSDSQNPNDRGQNVELFSSQNSCSNRSQFLFSQRRHKIDHNILESASSCSNIQNTVNRTSESVSEIIENCSKTIVPNKSTLLFSQRRHKIDHNILESASSCSNIQNTVNQTSESVSEIIENCSKTIVVPNKSTLLFSQRRHKIDHNILESASSCSNIQNTVNQTSESVSEIIENCSKTIVVPNKSTLLFSQRRLGQKSPETTTGSSNNCSPKSTSERIDQVVDRNQINSLIDFQDEHGNISHCKQDFTKIFTQNRFNLTQDRSSNQSFSIYQNGNDSLKRNTIAFNMEQDSHTKLPNCPKNVHKATENLQAIQGNNVLRKSNKGLKIGDPEKKNMKLSEIVKCNSLLDFDLDLYFANIRTNNTKPSSGILEKNPEILKGNISNLDKSNEESGFGSQSRNNESIDVVESALEKPNTNLARTPVPPTKTTPNKHKNSEISNNPKIRKTRASRSPEVNSMKHYNQNNSANEADLLNLMPSVKDDFIKYNLNIDWNMEENVEQVDFNERRKDILKADDTIGKGGNISCEPKNDDGTKKNTESSKVLRQLVRQKTETKVRKPIKVRQSVVDLAKFHFVPRPPKEKENNEIEGREKKYRKSVEDDMENKLSAQNATNENELNQIAKVLENNEPDFSGNAPESPTQLKFPTETTGSEATSFLENSNYDNLKNCKQNNKEATQLETKKDAQQNLKRLISNFDLDEEMRKFDFSIGNPFNRSLSNFSSKLSKRGKNEMILPADLVDDGEEIPDKHNWVNTLSNVDEKRKDNSENSRILQELRKDQDDKNIKDKKSEKETRDHQQDDVPNKLTGPNATKENQPRPTKKLKFINESVGNKLPSFLENSDYDSHKSFKQKIVVGLNSTSDSKTETKKDAKQNLKRLISNFDLDEEMRNFDFGSGIKNPFSRTLSNIRSKSPSSSDNAEPKMMTSDKINTATSTFTATKNVRQSEESRGSKSTTEETEAGSNSNWCDSPGGNICDKNLNREDDNKHELYDMTQNSRKQYMWTKFSFPKLDIKRMSSSSRSNSGDL